MRMPFGKHRDRLIDDLPTSYLQWCLRNVEFLREDLQDAMEKVLEDRGADIPDRSEYGFDDSPSFGHGRANGSSKPFTAPPPEKLSPCVGNLVRRWYRMLCLQCHPDRGGDVSSMQKLNEELEMLREALAPFGVQL